MPEAFRTPRAWRQSLDARIKAEAKARNRPVSAVRRELAYQRFLARVFTSGDGGWVLKGGVGLLMRTPTARHSMDVDLAYASGDEQALQDLALAVNTDLGDGLRYLIGNPTPIADAKGFTVSVEAFFASTTTSFQRFPVDVVTHRATPGEIEHTTPEPVVRIEQMPELPPFPLYPITAQIADKVCAVYSTYGADGTQPSTRFRDLVDLVIIACTQSIDATTLSSSLTREAASRDLTLPPRITLPSPRWRDGYRQQVITATVPAGFRDVDQAIALVAEFLDPLLSGQEGLGTWTAETQHWSQATSSHHHQKADGEKDPR